MTRVLVVDDEPHVRELLRRALSQWGYEVVEAENGSDSLDKFQSALPDVILMDVAMPIMNGFQALRKLRESPSSRTTPVILVTTYPASEGEPLGMSLGCQHYISKPFDLDVLKATIRVVLREVQTSIPNDDLAQPGLPATAEAPLSSPPPDASAAREDLLPTGIDLLDHELSGGLSRRSLTLIEGTSGVGKSVLCHHLAYRCLLNNQTVLYISSAENEASLAARMSSIGLGLSQHPGQGQLQTRCFKDLDLDNDSDPTLAVLSQMVREAPRDCHAIIIDSVTNDSIYGQEPAMLHLLEQCKGQCNQGQTFCVVTHSAVLEQRLWLQLNPLLDTHIRLSLKPMGRNLVKTLEVLKHNNAEVHTGHRIAFNVQPGVGIVTTRISEFNV